MYTAQDTIQKRHEIKRQRPRQTNLMQGRSMFLLDLWVREQVLTFYYSLRIFCILEWIILNKRKYLCVVFLGGGFFLFFEPPSSGKVFWTENDSTLEKWESCFSEVIFWGCFPFYLVYIFLLKILLQLFTVGIAALLKVCGQLHCNCAYSQWLSCCCE